MSQIWSVYIGPRLFISSDWNLLGKSPDEIRMVWIQLS